MPGPLMFAMSMASTLLQIRLLGKFGLSSLGFSDLLIGMPYGISGFGQDCVRALNHL
jgi:hypothetical protein